MGEDERKVVCGEESFGCCCDWTANQFRVFVDTYMLLCNARSLIPIDGAQWKGEMPIVEWECTSRKP